MDQESPVMKPAVTKIKLIQQKHSSFKEEAHKGYKSDPAHTHRERKDIPPLPEQHRKVSFNSRFPLLLQKRYLLDAREKTVSPISSPLLYLLHLPLSAQPTCSCTRYLMPPSRPPRLEAMGLSIHLHPKLQCPECISLKDKDSDQHSVVYTTQQGPWLLNVSSLFVPGSHPQSNECCVQ